MSDDEMIYVPALGREVSVRQIKAFATATAKALQPIAESYRSPDGQAQRAIDEAVEAVPNCHCLCGAKHRDRMGVCLGEHSATEQALLQTPRGDVWVNICAPCAAAWA